MIAQIDEAEKLWPHSSSVITFTFHVENPCTCISPSAATSSPLRAPVPLEQLGREPPCPILRNPQPQLANLRDQGPAVIARAIAQPARCPLALLGGQRLRYLRFDHLLQLPTRRPATARAIATAFFGWARSSAARRISFSNVVLPSKPLQFANLALQGPVFGGRHHLLASAHQQQRTLEVEPSPAERLVRHNAMPAHHQRHRHPRPVRLLNDCRLLFRRPAPLRLHRRDHLNPVVRTSQDTGILLVLSQRV